MNKDQYKAALACLSALVGPLGGAVAIPGSSTLAGCCVPVLLLMAGYDMKQVRNILRIPSAWIPKHPQDRGFYLDEEIIGEGWVATKEVTEAEVAAALRARCSDYIGG